MNIGEICTHEVFTIEKEKYVYEAAERMEKHRIENLVVIEKKGKIHQPIAILTPAIFAKVITHNMDMKKTKIEEVMSKDKLVFTQKSQKVDEVLKIMAQKGIKKMLVLDEDNHLVGIATIDNIILFLEKELNLVSKVIAAQIPEHFNF